MLNAISTAIGLFSVLLIAGMSLNITGKMYQKSEERIAENAAEIMTSTFNSYGIDVKKIGNPESGR